MRRHAPKTKRAAACDEEDRAADRVREELERDDGDHGLQRPSDLDVAVDLPQGERTGEREE